MPNVTLNDLIEDSLSLLYRDAERPLTVTVGSDALANAADTSLTLNAAVDWNSVQVGDRLEYGTEVMLVTAKSADATPVFTVRRGQFNTPNAGAVATSEVMLLNPLWHRRQVWDRVVQFIGGSMVSYLPFRSTQSGTRTANKGWMALSADTIDVYGVFVVSTESGEKFGFDNWDFDDNFPTALVSSGKALVPFPVAVPDTTTVYVQCLMPYVWYTTLGVALAGDPTTGTDYVTILAGSRDLIPLYVASYMVTGRELTRVELDTVEEWSQDQAARQGLNVRIIRELWAQFFRRVDDLQKRYPYPKPRPFRRRRNYA